MLRPETNKTVEQGAIPRRRPQCQQLHVQRRELSQPVAVNQLEAFFLPADSTHAEAWSPAPDVVHLFGSVTVVPEALLCRVSHGLAPLSRQRFPERGLVNWTAVAAGLSYQDTFIYKLRNEHCPLVMRAISPPLAPTAMRTAGGTHGRRSAAYAAPLAGVRICEFTASTKDKREQKRVGDGLVWNVSSLTM
jgi:hypothetical protein